MFSRRTLLKRLGLTALFPLIGAGPACPRQTVRLLGTGINGMAYYDADEALVASLDTGQALSLRREPGNPFDDRAIEVFMPDGTKLGYIPRDDNPVLAALADAGVPLSARVAGTAPFLFPYDCVEIDVLADLPA